MLDIIFFSNHLFKSLGLNLMLLPFTRACGMGVFASRLHKFKTCRGLICKISATSPSFNNDTFSIHESPSAYQIKSLSVSQGPSEHQNCSRLCVTQAPTRVLGVRLFAPTSCNLLINSGVAKLYLFCMASHP